MIGSALREVLRLRGYRYLAVGLFVPGLVFYLVTLPATYTGGTIGWVSLHYLSVELSLVALILALLLSAVFTLNVYSARTALRQQGTGLSVAAVLASLVPSSVCCTPLVPAALATLGASTPQIFSVTGRIQGGVARYEAALLVLSVVFLLAALRLAARSVRGSCRLPEGKGVIDASRGGSFG